MPLIETGIAHHFGAATDIKRVLAIVAVTQDAVIKGVPPGMIPLFFRQAIQGAYMGIRQPVQQWRVVRADQAPEALAVLNDR